MKGDEVPLRSRCAFYRVGADGSGLLFLSKNFQYDFISFNHSFRTDYS